MIGTLSTLTCTTSITRPSLPSRARPNLLTMPNLSSSSRSPGFPTAVLASSSSSSSSSYSSYSSFIEKRPIKKRRPEPGNFIQWIELQFDLPVPISKDHMMDAYVKLTTQLFGSEEQARNSIYCIEHVDNYAFRVSVDMDRIQSFRDLPNVRKIYPVGYIAGEKIEFGGVPLNDVQNNTRFDKGSLLRLCSYSPGSPDPKHLQLKQYSRYINGPSYPSVSSPSSSTQRDPI